MRIGLVLTAGTTRGDLALRAEAAVNRKLSAIACTPDEAGDQREQWKELTDQPILYAPTVGVPPERVRANLDAIVACFGSRREGRTT
jgi:hypothetical protein